MTREGPLKAMEPRWKRIARRVIPTPALERIAEWRELRAPERRAYLRVHLRRLGGRARPLPVRLHTEGTMLFVCHGNIIRSALAAALVRHHGAAAGLDVRGVRSAGLSARPGREADARAQAAGRTLGIDLAEHRAQPVTKALIDGAAAVFVMDRLNEATLLARFPDAQPKVRRFGALALESGDDVIADPYVRDSAEVEAVARRIDAAARTLVHALMDASARERGSSRSR